MNETLVFTPSAVLGLLTQIEELKDMNVSMTEDGSNITFSIGDSSYSISSSDAEEVEVNSEAIEQIEDVNDEGYSDLDDVTQDYVEGGILKEIAKTLLIGGMVRLTDKMLDKNRK